MSRRSKRRTKRETADHRDRWMITYADLITLLLIFFVIMYAMSNLDTGKYDVVTQSLQSTFNKSNSILELGNGLGDTPGQTISKTPSAQVQGESDNKQENPASDSEKDTPDDTNRPLTEREEQFRTQEQELQNLFNVITQYIEDNKLENQIYVADKPQGISITLSDRFLFDQGQAALKKDAAPTLSKLASLFRNLQMVVSIEGHTDNVPIGANSTYKDNWELSGERALSILRFFLDKEKLDPDHFQYAGYADTRPTGDNKTPAGRQKNRRVEITVLRQLQP
ncbi:flagellar motor protein MotB [Paenibacillus silvae]|uniref:flagellar motor protein MotB n=1 Tax=Paenibacillus silvae TaxID=1325358 RepID=UPI0020057677|nr:flagellar motor protein MotB [Paenibacillus silvae]MCK6075630.1 OmpA family protein [Paenibacillus silvae]MCK6150017.1 OmpA family protein [Paenibacillus silvae]MCK6268315.1 OmpA family protein [Paenibacillus silvae]